jgi:transposase-like protein
MIGGEGIIVEIDESKFGKRKYHRGHRVEGAWVFGGVERAPEKRTFVQVVEDRSERTLLQAIRENIHPGSIIHSDMWRGYSGIWRHLNMVHRTVNHSEGFKDPETGVHTNTIEGVWNGFKLATPPRNRVKESLSGHLWAIIWRKENKDNLWEGFLECLKDTAYV